ncbi:MAG TPA: TonB-dependent receptor [Acidobacteriaceae bacterium]|nr:TonB-dependent receptor [Acidobacteriaceae bacterium]
MTSRAFGQVDEGTITGTVEDSTGAVIPGARVTLLNTDVGLQLQTTTSSSGAYTFSPIRIGHYTVTVTANGFATTTQSNITLNVSQVLQVNVLLKPGTASQTVEVTAAPPLLQTQSASVGQVIGARTVNDLPLNGRNFTFLAQLAPGAQSPQADTRGNAASGAFSANGLRPAQNNYLLDGIDNNSDNVDFLNGTNFVVLPPLDAIQEFKVETADFSAQYGRAGGAVLNATIKSGTNQIHGAIWEFFRNRVLDAADWFEDYHGIPKGALQQNQFGVSIGGPFIKNKLFFFGDYEGLRRVLGSPQTGSVPSTLEANSGFTNMSDLIAAQTSSAPLTDALGRTIPQGTILDPATTRPVTAGEVDPVSGMTATTTGYVRDPFTTTCGATPPGGTYSIALCPDLNQIPADRLDPNAVKLLKLYPAPSTSNLSSLFSNFGSNPNLFEHRNAFDIRTDYDASSKDQVFFRVSYVDDPEYIPGIFGGIADGGAFQQGIQTAKAYQYAFGWTHVFNPSTINVAHVGLNHLHATRFGPEGSNLGIPEQYGILGIPQVAENGGLPEYDIAGLSTLGSNSFLPSDEISQTLQLTDDFTKIWGQHSFKMGIESQHIKFDTLQPAFSRGNFDYNGTFVDVPNSTSGNVGRGQFLLTPETASVPNGVDYSGGSDSINASNINTTYDYKTYTALYFEDDWKVTSKLTLNLGLRWDYFGPIQETNGGQANFVPTALNNGTATYLLPATGKDDRTLSSTANNPALNGNGFLDLLAKDGIDLEETNRYGRGLMKVQKDNFGPRLGASYQMTPNLVLRGGFGLSYNSFENQGYGPNIGENYPFVYNFSYSPQVPAGSPNGLQNVVPIGYNTPWQGCANATPGGTYTLESGLSCIVFSPADVNAQGLGLQGAEFNWQTPRTLSANFTVQYAINRNLTAQAAYVLTHVDNLQIGTSTNNVSTILPATASTTNAVPWPDFSHGMSYQETVGTSTYNGLQTKLEQQYSNGLSFLFTYTYSKTLSDAGDLLNGGSTGGFRAPSVPGLGPQFDRALADFDIRNVFHFSGGYDLPFGRGKTFASNVGRTENYLVGGWAINWILTLQGGQPLNFGCPDTTAAGLSCNDLLTGDPKLGLHKDSNGALNWIGNAAAFNQPCELGVSPPTPTGCIPLTGSAALGQAPGQVPGPGYHRLDFSTFKNVKINERWSAQFRAEFFNITNHPNFNAPNFGGNGVVAIGGSGNYLSSTFGEIGSTRDSPYDPRQIQFALKLYY